MASFSNAQKEKFYWFWNLWQKWSTIEEEDVAKEAQLYTKNIKDKARADHKRATLLYSIDE